MAINCESIEHSFELNKSASTELMYTKYKFPQGVITYINESGCVVIYYICIKDEYKNQGIWSKFISYLQYK